MTAVRRLRAARGALAVLLSAVLGATLLTGASPAVAAPSSAPMGTNSRAVPASPLSGPVAAARAEDFDPGNIITDAVFFNPNTMTDHQVQAFLTAQGAKCTPNSLACLKDYVSTTVAKPADAYCRGYGGGLQQSAAQIIVGVAQSCGINPRVLIVLLEKEQSLVTRSTPTTYAYERATGFGCPDTAPCNAEYFGLFNQLYLAARQFQRYSNGAPYTWIRVGHENNILFHPDASCGSAPVLIQNRATAGLYYYTPYQPNAAALEHFYSVVPDGHPGKACAAYGNRNFFRLFSDWFGDPRAGGFLVRTVENATVYLVAGTTKYALPSAALLGAYAPLGPIGYVSQNYLDGLTTGAQTASRFAKSPSGSVYFVDGGVKFPFGTCTVVEAWGGSCAALVALTDVQVAALADGGTMRTTARTGSGRLYHVAAGVRHEVADDASLVAAGLSTTSVTISDEAVAALPVGDPVVRDGVVVQHRKTAEQVLVHSAGRNPVPEALRTGTALSALPVLPLDGSSMARLAGGPALSPFVTPAEPVDGAGGPLLLRGSSATPLAGGDLAPEAVVTVGPEVLDGFTVTEAVSAPVFVQAVGDPQVYQLDAGQKRRVLDAEELAVLGGEAPTVLSVTAAVAGLLPTGRDAGLTMFDDVRVTAPFAPEIVWLATSGIAGGYEDGTFRPTAPVSRQAMAAFLHRMAGSPAHPLPATPTFADVPAGHPFATQIEWLASEGITTGTLQPDGTRLFAPTAAVSRGAMAAFLYRSADSPATTPADPPPFADVGPGSAFRTEIEWLASVGVTTGTPQPDGTSLYLPASPVSRQAMAAFLSRFDDL